MARSTSVPAASPRITRRSISTPARFPPTSSTSASSDVAASWLSSVSSIPYVGIIARPVAVRGGIDHTWTTRSCAPRTAASSSAKRSASRPVGDPSTPTVITPVTSDVFLRTRAPPRAYRPAPAPIGISTATPSCGGNAAPRTMALARDLGEERAEPPADGSFVGGHQIGAPLAQSPSPASARSWRRYVG